jgi:hypothetical protein
VRKGTHTAQRSYAHDAELLLLPPDEQLMASSVLEYFYLCMMVIAQPKSLRKALCAIIWFVLCVGLINLMNRSGLLDQNHPCIIILTRHRDGITNSKSNRGRMFDNLAVSKILRRRQYRQISVASAALATFSLVKGLIFSVKQNNSFFFHGVTFSRTITQTGK